MEILPNALLRMSSPSQLIIRRDSSSTTSLSIERPRALNALTPEIVDGIRVEYTRLIATSTQPHVVILKGSGEKVSCCDRASTRFNSDDMSARLHLTQLQ